MDDYVIVNITKICSLPSIHSKTFLFKAKTRHLKCKLRIKIKRNEQIFIIFK